MSKSPHTPEFGQWSHKSIFDGIGFMVLLPFKTKKEILHIHQILK